MKIETVRNVLQLNKVSTSAVAGRSWVLNVLKSTEIWSGHFEAVISVISQVSAVEGCPLSGVPLYHLLSPSSYIVAPPQRMY